MAQNVTKKLKGMNGHAVAVGYGSPNRDTGHVVLGSSKRCSVQAQEKLSKPFVSLGQDVTNRLKFKLKRLNLQPITCESPKGDDGRQVVLEASRGCSLLQAWEKHFKALDSAKILDSAGHDEHTVPVGLENPKGDAKHLVLEGSERSSFCVALEKHDKTLDNTACVKTLDSTGQDGHAVPVGVHSPKGEAWHPVSKRRSFRQAREKHVKTLDNTGQDLCPVPVGLDWPKSDARQSVLGASKRCLEAQEKLSKTPVEVGQTVAKKSKGLDGDAVSFGYDSSKDDARHLLLEASKSFLQAHEKLSKQLDNMGQDISKKLKFKIKLKKGLHGRVVPVGNDGLKGDAGKLVHEASKSVEQGTGGVTDGGENNKVDQCTLTEAKSIKPKLVRISVTDGDATESSSDEEAEPLATGPRVKKFINEIMIESSSTKSDSGVWRSRTTRLGGKKKAGKSELPETCQTLKVQTTWRKFRGVKAQATKNKFLGVRQRPWGRWAAEIREPQSGRRLWLGTFDTAQEAAMVYDKAALLLRGPDTFTNFTTSQVVDEDGRKLEEAQLK